VGRALDWQKAQTRERMRREDVLVRHDPDLLPRDRPQSPDATENQLRFLEELEDELDCPRTTARLTKRQASERIAARIRQVRSRKRTVPATDAQVAFLVKLGVPRVQARRLTKGEARDRIDRELARRKNAGTT
jgi:hypothetical protein